VPVARQLVSGGSKFEFAIAKRADCCGNSSSIEFGHRCREAGVRPSMGSVGDAYDNAMCESFFATLSLKRLMQFSRKPLSYVGRAGWRRLSGHM
jgi:hypothetical protein